MRTKADCIIVGAGPAGSVCATYLARRGIGVRLVDRSTFPREKVCGDGVTVRAIEVLEDLGLLDWAEDQGFPSSDAITIGAPDRSMLHVPYRALGLSECEKGRVIPRVALDQALVDRAQAAGAVLDEGVRIEALAREGAERVVVLGNRSGEAVSYEAPLVVAADGGQSTFTRTLGLVERPADAVAVRRYYEGVTGVPGRIQIHWEPTILPGYGWLFHMKDGRANVGLGIQTRRLAAIDRPLRHLLDVFVTENPAAREALSVARPLGPAKGHPLRMDADRTRKVLDNLLVAGEAAGLVHPLTGEGIAPAMISGRIAAEVIADALAAGRFDALFLAAYQRRVDREFKGFHRAARLLRFMMQRPALLTRQIRRARHDTELARLMVQVVLGDAHPGILLTPNALIRTLLG